MTRIFIIGLTLMALTACETAKGVGRDVESAGDTITDTADDVQEDL